MRLRVRTLMPGDIEHIAGNVRAADRAEILAASGEEDMYQVIADAVIRSTHYWVSATDRPVAIFGCTPMSLLGGVGVPWALATDEVLRYPSALVREGRRYVQRMLAVFPHLYNYVDARNTRSVRWLARIGFEIQPAAPYGAAGLPFHRFELRA